MSYCILTFNLVIFFLTTTPTQSYTLSLHDALPIYARGIHGHRSAPRLLTHRHDGVDVRCRKLRPRDSARDRKSTRLNSSHLVISYAVFCLKEKTSGERTY